MAATTRPVRKKTEKFTSLPNSQQYDMAWEGEYNDDIDVSHNYRHQKYWEYQQATIPQQILCLVHLHQTASALWGSILHQVDSIPPFTFWGFLLLHGVPKTQVKLPTTMLLPNTTTIPMPPPPLEAQLPKLCLNRHTPWAVLFAGNTYGCLSSLFTRIVYQSRLQSTEASGWPPEAKGCQCFPSLQ